MKLLPIILLVVSFVFAKDIWYVHTAWHPDHTLDKKTGKLMSKFIKHGTIKHNGVEVKYNVRKGRLKITCGGLCPDSAMYLIRFFDRDSLRLDFVAEDLHPDKNLTGNEYKVPDEIIKEISYLDIIPYDETWEPTVEVECDDGYELEVDEDKLDPEDRNSYTGFASYARAGYSKCVKRSKAYWEDKYECPPAWRLANGTCQAGWKN